MKQKKAKSYLLLFIIFAIFVSININASAEPKTVAVISGKSYASLQKAINAVKNGETITLLENVSTKTQAKINKPQKTFSINFAGNSYRYTGSGNAFLIQSGNVTVKNINIVSKNYVFYVKKNARLTVESGKCYGYHYNAGTYDILSGNFSTKGAKKSEHDELIQNHGTMTINNGNFNGLTDNAVYNLKKITIKAGNFKCSAQLIQEDDNYPTVMNCVKSSCTIIKGNFSGTGSAIDNDGGTVNISGGTYTSSSSRVIGNFNGGAITIYNGIFTRNSKHLLYSNYDGDTIIKGGVFKGQVANATNGNFKMTIYDGNFSESIYPTLYNRMGIVEIKGGTFSSQKSSTIENNKEGTFKISNGKFKCTDYYYSLYNEGRAYISGGEFSTKDNYNSIASVKGSVLQVGSKVKYTGVIDYK